MHAFSVLKLSASAGGVRCVSCISFFFFTAPCTPLLTTHEYTQQTKQNRWLVRAKGVLGPAHVSYINTAQFEISLASAQKGGESDI